MSRFKNIYLQVLFECNKSFRENVLRGFVPLDEYCLNQLYDAGIDLDRDVFGIKSFYGKDNKKEFYIDDRFIVYQNGRRVIDSIFLNRFKNTVAA